MAPPFLVEDYVPRALITLSDEAKKRELREKCELHLSECRLCAHDCGVNRLENKMGVCNTGNKAVVSAAFPHFGEESVLQASLSNVLTYLHFLT